MYEKYGKSVKGILKIKKNFLDENNKFLEIQNTINEIYKTQDKRQFCKCCMTSLKGNEFFSHGLTYVLCDVCGHLNGKYEETAKFSETVYERTEYDDFYIDKDEEKFNDRVKAIYVPKLDFLMNVIGTDTIKSSKILDVGAGSGYFCKACLLKNLKVKGIEISEKQVVYASEMLKKDVVKKVNADESLEIIRQTDCNIVTMFGVIESVYNLQEIMNAIEYNDNIKYLYFNVPMFSLSVCLESVNPESFNRNLGGAHTHLFSNKSVKHLLGKFHLDMMAKWRFGSDMMDMWRFVSNKLNLMDNQQLNEIFSEKFMSMIDDLQLVLDKHEFSSEVHIIAKKQKGSDAF